MGRIYDVPFTGTVTAAGGDVDLFSLQPADDRPIRLLGFTLGQISEVGDAAEEGVRITVRRLTATVTIGSGGAVVTAAPPGADSGESAWSFTARANDTTVATTNGTNQILREVGWNIRSSPYDFLYPDARYAPKARQAEALIIRLETTLADDITFMGSVTVEEE